MEVIPVTENEPREKEGELVRFGDLREGDVIDGPHGPVTVTKAYEEHIPETMFRLTFEDGSSVDASGSHLWYVESASDRAVHLLRLKNSRATLAAALDKETREQLLLLATAPRQITANYNDFAKRFFDKTDDAALLVLSRVCQSLGHIAEVATHYEDLYDGSVHEEYTQMVKEYDARAVAQQLLALVDPAHAKRWPVVKGQVVSTLELMNIPGDIHIPVVESREAPQRGLSGRWERLRSWVGDFVRE